MEFQKEFPKIINFSIINIDKPSGPTSFQISNYIKNSLKLNKTSHFGTLDPKVSGVLPIALGRACRLAEYFLHSNKEYVGIMRLHSIVKEEELVKEINNFIGKIKQLPPVRSRVKREIREREVKSFTILEIQNKDVLFKIEVEAGTYIRKLIHDLGKKIGGAHMLELRRIRASIFSEENSINLYEFDEALKDEERLIKILIPAEEALKKIFPVVKISDKNLRQILTGKPLKKEDFIYSFPKNDRFIAFIENRFIGVYKKTNESEIIARPEFVFN